MSRDRAREGSFVAGSYRNKEPRRSGGRLRQLGLMLRARVAQGARVRQVRHGRITNDAGLIGSSVYPPELGPRSSLRNWMFLDRCEVNLKPVTRESSSRSNAMENSSVLPRT